MKSDRMARLTCCLLLVWASVGAAMPNAGQRGVPLAAGVPEARQNAQAERFTHGFASDFAKNLPTSEFLGSFAGRQKRQVAVTSAIEGILSTHYGGEPATPHLQALLTRNSLARPARQSPSSLSSPSFSASSSSSPSSTRPQAPIRPDFQSPPRPSASFSAPSSSSSSSSSFRPLNRPPTSRPNRRQAPRPQQASFRPSTPARPQFSPSRRESFTPSHPFPTFQEASSRTSPENHFPSSTFAGQQFETLFSGFDSFESARLPRQKRDVTARQDVSSQLAGILTSPWEGSVPNSISSLLNRNNRFPRNPNVDSKLPSSSSQVVEQPNRQAQPSPASFSLPFRIPNFFEVLGMKRRSLDVAQERQGITDTLEGFLTSPYGGSIPTSIDSLFRSNKNRFVRKTQPQPVAHPRPSPVASDDPSQAAVRLFPNNDNTGFHVGIPSGHRFQHHSRRKRDLLDASEDLQQSASGQRFRRRPRPGPPGRNSHNRARAKRPHHSKKPEARRPNFNDFDDQILHDSNDQLFDLSELEGFPSANFLDNFNAPFPNEDFEFEEISLESSDVRDQVRPALKKPSNRPTRLRRPLPRRPPPRRPSTSGRQHSPVGRPSPPRTLSPGLRPGPSPPAHILPPSNSVRAPRHILLRNRLMPKLTRQQDIPILRRSLQVAQRRQSDQSVTSDVAEAREDSAGFIVGKPDNFPLFSAIGGFGPMQDIEKGDSASSFVPAFSIPTMSIPDIPDQQPQFEFPQFAQQGRAAPRVRRTAGEPDALAPSDVPHKRVHRVGAEDQLPHSRNPREFRVIHDSELAPSEPPFRFESFPAFEFHEFQSKKITPEITSASFGDRSFSPAHQFPPSRGSVSRRVEAPLEDAHTDDQRFIPTVHPHSLPSHHQAFFPSPPLPPRTPGPRGGRFNSHSPGFRETHRQREEPSGFRDFHDTFYGPGAREALHKPEFTFPTNRRPHHREQEYGSLDNSLLGSGNFEVLRGGTFFDPDDPNSHGHGYDHFLDEGYAVFPNSHNAPPTNNYVDDFFSNFRDFSEFAVRRSDEGETITLDDESFFGPGFASEHVQQVVEASNNTETGTESEHEEAERPGDNEDGSLPHDNTSDTGNHHKHRQPKNIQEVLEDLEAEPSEYSVSALTIDENDPLIAMF
ncbi:uncharacterized protein LOC134772760 isoform X1 [Penaeus indicus]|uniref:uncharacterized protein LOC134772760 isoform X1 n=1 Tax=Penaeus indicus TaxID=29960 RepID=UPI00300C8C1D